MRRTDGLVWPTVTGMVQQHISEEEIDLFCQGRMDEPALAVVEEHLLVCANCQERVEQTDDFIRVFRQTAQERPQPKVERVSFWQKLFAGGGSPMPALAACCAVLVAVGIFWHQPVPPSAPVDVTLDAMRGETVGQTRVADAYRLHLNRVSLEAGESAEVAVVNDADRTVWQGTVIGGSEVTVVLPQKLSTGQYYVRLRRGGELLQEFALNVK